MPEYLGAGSGKYPKPYEIKAIHDFVKADNADVYSTCCFVAQNGSYYQRPQEWQATRAALDVLMDSHISRGEVTVLSNTALTHKFGMGLHQSIFTMIWNEKLYEDSHTYENHGKDLGIIRPNGRRLAAGLYLVKVQYEGQPTFMVPYYFDLTDEQKRPPEGENGEVRSDLTHHITSKSGGSGGRYLSCTSDGTVVDIYHTDDNSGRQQWKFTRAPGTTDLFNIIIHKGVTGGRRFLSCTSDGEKVDIYHKDDGSGRQRWKLVKLEDGFYNIEVAGGTSGGRKYLSCTSDGKTVDLYHQDDNSGRQRWRLESV